MSQKISIDLSAFQNNDSFMAEEHVVGQFFFLLVRFFFLQDRIFFPFP